MIRLICRNQLQFVNSMLTGQKYIKTSIQKRGVNFDFSNMFMKKDASIPLETSEIFDLCS